MPSIKTFPYRVVRSNRGSSLRISIIAAALFSTASIGLGQQPARSPAASPSVQPGKVVALLNDARLAAPEMGADIFLRVAQSNQVIGRARKLDILDEASRMLADVKHPVRQTAIPFKGIPVDTRAGYLSYAFDLKLDRLSLRSRLIRQMITLDKERAKFMVQEIGGRLDLKPLKCTDTMAYDTADIYTAVGEVAKSVFTKREVDEGVRALFVSPWLENIESPTQIGPALDLLGGLNGPPVERHLLAAALSKAIARNFRDDRSFTFAIERGRLAHKVIQWASGPDDPTKTDVRSAFREFLDKNFRAPRCRYNEIESETNLPRYFLDANLMYSEKPFKFEEVKTTDVLEGPVIEQYWQSEDARRFMREFSLLRRKDDTTTGTDADKAEERWEARVRKFLDELNSWKPSEKETESDIFNQKGVLMIGLLNLAGESPVRTTIFREHLRFLDLSPMVKNNFIEWIFHVKKLYSTDPATFKRLANEVANPHFRLVIAEEESLL